MTTLNVVVQSVIVESSAISELYSCKKTDIAGGNRAFNSRVLTGRTCFLSAGTSSNRWSKKLLQYNYRWEHYS
jgi:hypothetical protein